MLLEVISDADADLVHVRNTVFQMGVLARNSVATFYAGEAHFTKSNPVNFHLFDAGIGHVLERNIEFHLLMLEKDMSIKENSVPFIILEDL